MLEEIISLKRVFEHPLFSIIVGILYVLVGASTSIFFFQRNISLMTMFLVTILVIPTILKLLTFEEKAESGEGLSHFFSNHKKILQIYVFLFLGIFIGYAIFAMMGSLGFISFEETFSYQLGFLQQGDLTKVAMLDFFQKGAVNGTNSFFYFLQHNVGVVLICFILSFFYGAGGIFLLVLNASIFATTLIVLHQYLSEGWVHFAQILGIFSIHLIPEVVGFLIAAIAGGVVSKAFLVEKFGSDGFSNVMRDAFVLLMIALVLIVIGAGLEAYVTPRFFMMAFL